MDSDDGDATCEQNNKFQKNKFSVRIYFKKT